MADCKNCPVLEQKKALEAQYTDRLKKQRQYNKAHHQKRTKSIWRGNKEPRA